MKENVQSGKTGKFLFDVNIFDDDNNIIRPADVEPPPIFTLSDLESAKQQAFEKGHQTAMRETTRSREEHLTDLIAKISHETQALFDAEQQREMKYEEEAIRLAAALMQKLFPAFEQRYGLEELKHIVADALEKTRGKADLVIETHPQNVEGLENYIQELKTAGAMQFRFRLVPNESFAPDACKISWSDGGVIRDSKALADQIGTIMEETLAAKARSGHSNISGD